MSSEAFAAGDVFWAPDPYNSGTNPRPWLVLAAENLPYVGEEYLCAGLTLSNLPGNVKVTDQDWVVGNNPEKTSYCSPWVLATVKHDSVAGSQGAVSEAFARTIVRKASDYLSQDLGVEL